MSIPKFYRGFEVRINRKQGILQSARPADLIWGDSPSARTWADLKALIDCTVEGF